MKSAVHDAGAIIAAEKGDRRFWAEHRARQEMGWVLAAPAPVVARAVLLHAPAAIAHQRR